MGKADVSEAEDVFVRLGLFSDLVGGQWVQVSHLSMSVYKDLASLAVDALRHVSLKVLFRTVVLETAAIEDVLEVAACCCLDGGSFRVVYVVMALHSNLL